MRFCAGIRLLGLLSPLVMAASPLAAAPPAAAMKAPSLATAEQLAAERAVLKLSGEPRIKALQQSLAAELASGQLADSPDAKSQVQRAVRLWTSALIIREYTAGLPRPAITWTPDDTPHTWFGHTIEGMATSGDNPDHIYRYAALDGTARYVIDGWIAQGHRPVQFSFESTHGTPSVYGSGRSSRSADMGDQIGMLTDRDIAVDGDGHFRLTVGGPGGGGNHLPLSPGPVSLNVRDVLSDWNQRPIRLTIDRVDGGRVRPIGYAELRQRVLDHLSAYVHTWASFKVTWLGGIKPNTIVGPVGRAGGWGYIAGGRFSLAPGEALQITTSRGPAAYAGVQVTDPWIVAPDGSRHLTSLNISQAKPDSDGSYTYILSPQDPGVANWIDSAGLRNGYVLLRWQQLPPEATADGLLKDYKVIRLADGLPQGLVKVTPEQRAAQMAEHRSQYANRLAPPD